MIMAYFGYVFYFLFDVLISGWTITSYASCFAYKFVMLFCILRNANPMQTKGAFM